jgi:hypothetical protein
MIVFEFPEDGPQDFYSAEGYAEISVSNGKLMLEDEPGEALLNLIKKFEGKRVEAEAKPKTTKAKAEKEGDNS